MPERIRVPPVCTEGWSEEEISRLFWRPVPKPLLKLCGMELWLTDEQDDSGLPIYKAFIHTCNPNPNPNPNPNAIT